MADLSVADSASRFCFQSDCNGDSEGPGFAEIIVVRHGQTESNADGRVQGHLEVELDEVGKRQAAAVAERLSKESKVSAVYSSDLKRALDTAKIIASSCGSLEVIEDSGLRERHKGVLQGLLYREAARLNPEAYQALLSHRRDQEIPGGGESRDQVYQRCTSSLQKIAKKHRGERVVVVTHAGVVKSLYKRASSERLSTFKIRNASISIFHLFDGDEWVIKVWDDVGHLSQTGFLEWKEWNFRS